MVLSNVSSWIALLQWKNKSHRSRRSTFQRFSASSSIRHSHGDVLRQPPLVVDADIWDIRSCVEPESINFMSLSLGSQLHAIYMSLCSCRSTKRTNFKNIRQRREIGQRRLTNFKKIPLHHSQNAYVPCAMATLGEVQEKVLWFDLVFNVDSLRDSRGSYMQLSYHLLLLIRQTNAIPAHK